jgi:hypothetical protein
MQQFIYLKNLSNNISMIKKAKAKVMQYFHRGMPSARSLMNCARFVFSETENHLIPDAVANDSSSSSVWHAISDSLRL